MDTNATIDFLKTSKDKNATLQMLKTHTKKDLLDLAKTMDIITLQSYPKTQVIDNIYSSTVGLRLIDDVFKSRSGK